MTGDIPLSISAKRALNVHLSALEKAQHALQAFLQGVAAGIGVDPDTHSFDMQRAAFVPNPEPTPAPAIPAPAEMPAAPPIEPAPAPAASDMANGAPS